MISLKQSIRNAGISSNELMLGVSPSARHYSLLTSYLLNLDRGVRTVRDMIVCDLRGFIDLGVAHRAADAFLVLRLFLTRFPEAAGARRAPRTAACVSGPKAR
jgi:hypothetical protein